MVKKKVEIKLFLENGKKRKKALTAAVGMKGIISTSIDGDKIVIEGEDMDLVALTTVLRKKLGYADLISVTTGDEKKDKKKEDTPVMIPWHYPVYPHPYPYARPEVSQDSCSIM